MFPNSTVNTNDTTPALTDYERLCREFVADVRSQLSTLMGEISSRNKTILDNDSYVYGDLLARTIKVPIGHDFTPVNWLRRTAEIHRVQTMQDGFAVTSSYHGQNVDNAADPQAAQMLQLQNEKSKAYAEKRGEIIEGIIRDNGGMALWARLVENASVIGSSVVKAWYDPDKKKYTFDMIEAVEHFYALWSRNNFREFDMCGYVYQISKQRAVEEFHVPPTVATSPLGQPLAVLSAANTVEYISTQPMVTIMEITGRVQGWGSTNGILHRVDVGEENNLNCTIVADRVKSVIDDKKYMPKYYILPNKLVRRRPWGYPDITRPAINLNQTYIETLSDWRTVASKVNFPKYKAFGFGLDAQLPKPKARTVEFIGLGDGQDIQPIQNPNSDSTGEIDWERQLAELKEEFVREVGISQQLFDNPDVISDSNQAMLTAMKSIGDQVAARRQLWTPIITRMFEDAFDVLGEWDDSIKELTTADPTWYLRVTWPPALRKDDPAYQTMLINRLNTSTISIQSFMERIGENGQEEIDRIKDELKDTTLAAIHGKMVQLLAEYAIAGPPSMTPPKTTVSLSGVMTPEQESNLASMHGFGNGPNFGPTAGPQGEQGTRANTDLVDQGLVSGQMYPTGTPLNFGPQPQTPANPNPASPQAPAQVGQPNSAPGTAPGSASVPAGNPAQVGGPTPPGGGATGQPAQVNDQMQAQTPTPNNQPGQQVMNAPGSGQPTSPEGAVAKSAQKKGR